MNRFFCLLPLLAISALFGIARATSEPRVVSYIGVNASTVWVADPWYSPYSVQGLATALFEMEFAEDLYFGGKKLDTLTMKDWYYNQTENEWYRGEVDFYLTDSAELTCGGWVFTSASGFLDILPAVPNPLGVIYGNQFGGTKTLSWSARKIVLALQLSSLQVTDSYNEVAMPDLLWDFTDGQLRNCSVSFVRPYVSDKTGVKVASVSSFKDKTFSCSPTTLATELDTIESYIANYKESVGAAAYESSTPWLTLPLAYATYTYMPSMQGCEELIADLTSYREVNVLTTADYCIERAFEYNTSCILRTGKISSCTKTNADRATDPCCTSSATGCCGSFSVTKTAPRFTINLAQCSASYATVVGIAFSDLANNQTFDTNPDSYIDATVDGAEADIAALQALYLLCAEEVRFTQKCEATNTTCFTTDSGKCVSGYCPGEPEQWDLFALGCVLYTALEYDDEFETFVNFLHDSGYSNETDTVDEQVTSALLALTYDDCSNAAYGASYTWVCPAGITASGASAEAIDYFCWQKWTAASASSCTTEKYCNWAPGLTSTQCAQSGFANGVCLGSTGEVLTTFAACVLDIDNKTFCGMLANTTWDSLRQRCVYKATTSAACYGFNFFKYGYNSYAALLSAETFCVDNKAANKPASCAWTYVPSLGICVNPYKTFAQCEANATSGQVYYIGRVWVDDVLTTASWCATGYCESGEVGLTAADCATRGDCDMSCSYCVSESPYEVACVSNTTKAACASMLGSAYYGSICLYPALTSEECATYNGAFLSCGSLSASQCSDRTFAGTTVVECGTITKPCASKSDCAATWYCSLEKNVGTSPFCLMPGSAVTKTTYNGVTSYYVTRYNVEAFVSVVSGMYYATRLNNTQCGIVGGQYITYPTTRAACESIQNTMNLWQCEKDWYGTAVDVPYFTGCETSCSGKKTAYYRVVNATWTADAIIPGVVLGLDWVVPNMTALNEIETRVNQTSLNTFLDGFGVYTYAEAYDEYATTMLADESPSAEKASCYCVSGNSNLDICKKQKTEQVVGKIRYSGKAETFTFPPAYAGGSQVTLKLPAGLPADLVINIVMRWVLDFASGSRKRATTPVEVALMVNGQQEGELLGDGYNIQFESASLTGTNPQLPVGVGLCISKPDFLIADTNAYPEADYASLNSNTDVFTFLEMSGVTYASATTCGSITSSDYYFPMLRVAATSSTLPADQSSGSNKKHLAALAALSALVLLLLVPVVVVAVIIALRSKTCKKTVRRVAPK
eukprot:TRINITY_DN4443_c0_g1_i1.p1 TRINITY_DN4443_c0_g1~~TRINITY_DN4443_c0_g1_i1.p1  ORF type:complete len:1256 (+),score=356.31 TRINITY_DN4443_c0_g1_i1:158-3925(+)